MMTFLNENIVYGFSTNPAFKVPGTDWDSMGTSTLLTTINNQVLPLLGPNEKKIDVPIVNEKKIELTNPTA